MKTAILVTLAVLFAVGAEEWQRSFNVDKKNLGPTGSNPYFLLQPGLRLHYAEGKNTSATTVLEETKVVDGVTVRVVEDREWKNGQVTEVTRDYYAADASTGDVFYFGEDVDLFKNGKVTGHGGSWLSGVKGAQFGLMMPGTIKAGRKFYQEQAPGVAMDRAELISDNATVTTPAGTFTRCVHMRETNPLEKGVSDDKWFAPGVGLVKDGKMVLVRIEKPR